MNRVGGAGVCAFLCVVAIAVLAAGAWAAEEEGTTDIVFALDISGSMNEQRRLETVRNRLCEFIENEVDIGANVTVITFGGSVKLVASQQIKSDENKTALVRKIKGIGIEMGGTYMTGGIELALQDLEKFHKNSPTRSRILVLLTDGRNHPPMFPPPDKQATFQKLLDRYEKRPDFVPGQDWFFWYCFIGQPDREVQEFVERLQGEAKPVNEGWHFIKVRFNRVLVKLGDVPVGDWTREFPPKDERDMGEKLTMTTRTPGEYELQLSDVILDDAGPNEKLTVAPKTIRMKEGQQAVVLTFTGQNIAPGTRHGRIVIRCPGKLLFVKPQQFHITFKAEQASVTIAPRDGLQFGRMQPGQSVEKTFELIPNPAAKLLAADNKAQVILPTDLPKGMSLSADPPSVALGAPASVRLKMELKAGAVLPPEGYKGAVRFGEIQGIEFTPAALAISTESPGKAMIDVAPTRVDFGPIQPGGEVVREVTLSPNEAAASLKPSVALSAAKALPKGITIKIEPPSAAVPTKAAVRLTLRRDAGAGKVGAIEGALALKVKDGLAALSQEELPWKAEGAAAFVEVTPNTGIDFGAMELEQKGTQSIWLSPNSVAAKMAPEVRVSADGLTDGAKLAFEPDRVKLTQKQEVKVTLTAGAKAGTCHVKVKLQCADPSVQLEVSELSATYEAQAGGITIDAQHLQYKDILPGDSEVRVSAPVTASAGAVGKTVAVEWELDLPEGMSATPSPSQITVSQARQDVPFALSLKGAVAGKHTGRVKFGSDVPVTPKELPVEIDVLARGIELVGVPEPWTIWTWGGGKVRAELPLQAKASPAAAGTKLSLQPLEGSSPQVRISAEPSELEVARGENRLRLKAVIDVGFSLPGAKYTSHVTWVTDPTDVAVRPEQVTCEVVVRSIGGPGVGLLLFLLFVLWRLTPPPIDPEAKLVLEKKSSSVTTRHNGEDKEHGEELEIGLSRPRRVWLHGPKPGKETDSDVEIVGAPDAVKPWHAKIQRKRKRGKPYFIKAVAGPVEIEPPSGSVIYVGVGRAERLYDQDKIKIGPVTFSIDLPDAEDRPDA